MRVTVVGTGYVGLVTGACLSGAGHTVVCVDISADRVNALRAGRIPFHEPGLDKLVQDGLKQGRLAATTSLEEAMTGSELSIIAVGTPPRDKSLDTRYLAEAAAQIGACLGRAAAYHVVVVKSTVMPGTTQSLVRQQLESASGLKAGSFGLCMNPEFLREGSAVADFMNPDRIVIGQWDERAGRKLAEAYSHFTCPVLHTTLSNAEMIKCTANALLATLISFSNELSGLCETVPGCDIDVVMDGVHLDRRLSPVVNGARVQPGILTYLRAGMGFGGSCLPKDVDALRGFGSSLGVATPVLDATAEVNHARPGKVVDMLAGIIGPLAGRTIAVLGLTFKAGSDDLRSSPSLTLVELLTKKGAIVKAFDPMIRHRPVGMGEGVVVCQEPRDALAGADAAVIATAWTEFGQFDWASLGKQMKQPVVLDARNAFRRIAWPAPVQYHCIGTHPRES